MSTSLHRNVLRHLFTSLSIALLFTGCGEADRGDAPEQSGELSSEPRYGGIFRMNVLRGDPKGLDPVLVDSKHADDIASQVFDDSGQSSPMVQVCTHTLAVG